MCAKKAKEKCTTEGCDRIQSCRSLCRKCYGKVWYEEYERKNRGAKKHIHKPVGDKFVNTYGYVVIKIQGSKGVKAKRELEHRYIMSIFLGRKLETYESVHHKNGNKQDNELDNLELWVTKQPRGQRPKDLIEYAKWILKTYQTKTVNEITSNNHLC